MGHPKFIIKMARNGQYYFNLTAKNGQVILSSEMYDSKQAVNNAIASAAECAPVAEIDDTTKKIGANDVGQSDTDES